MKGFELFSIAFLIGTVLWIIFVSALFSGCMMYPDGRVGTYWDENLTKYELQRAERIYGNGNDKLK